jgi:hypothetical protein
VTCSKCGYNPDKLTEYMKTVVPKSKIEAKIKELEIENDKPSSLMSPLTTQCNDSVIDELKDLLKE